MPNLVSLSIGAETLRCFAKTLLEAIESRCGGDRLGGNVAHIAELEIVGTERERRHARENIARKSLTEKWTAVTGKICIVETEEKVWSTRK